MRLPDDPRRELALAIPVVEVIERLGIAGLRRTGAEMIGPCPLCGGHDRFGINLSTRAFLCRKCDIRGGDQIALVRDVLGLGYLDALGWLVGEDIAADPAEAERRRARARAEERKREETAARLRARAIEDARRIWNQAKGAPLDAAHGYLQRRGIDPAALPVWPRVLRCIPDHPCVRKIGDGLVTVHRGPAMIALIQGPGGRGSAVHQTWIDLAAPKGKAMIAHEGKTLPSKIVRGSKRGGAIRLHTDEESGILVMGEGIETTLSALVARPVWPASYWAGVDLGNMAGRMQRVPGQRHSGLPDMEDRAAFVPPPWVRRLIYIQDGDSDPKATRAKLDCGLRRAQAVRPGLVAQIVHAGAGADLNDVLARSGEA